MTSLYLSTQKNQFIQPDVKRVDGNSEDESSNQDVYQLTSEQATPDETVKGYHQQLSRIHPSASSLYNRFSRVMRKRGNPYWMPRTPENKAIETDFQEVS